MKLETPSLWASSEGHLVHLHFQGRIRKFLAFLNDFLSSDLQLNILIALVFSIVIRVTPKLV